MAKILATIIQLQVAHNMMSIVSLVSMAPKLDKTPLNTVALVAIAFVVVSYEGNDDKDRAQLPCKNPSSKHNKTQS